MSPSPMELRGLEVAFGPRTVLTGVDLDVPAHAITALIGPSGCGKTSLLTCLNRLTDLIPNARVGGSVKLGGAEILGRALDLSRHRRRVGMIFQRPNPFPVSIYKNVALPLAKHGLVPRRELRDRVEAALDRVGLLDEVKDRLSSAALLLSGGQQQRLCLARALALEPEVILFDEPCSALDPLSTARIEALMIELKARHTILVVTHNLAQARRIADHTALLWPEGGVGRLVETGPTAAMFASPRLPITAAYLRGEQG